MNRQMPQLNPIILLLSAAFCTLVSSTFAQNSINVGLQRAKNPPMQTVSREPPVLPDPQEPFEVRDDFTLIESLDEFRAAIKASGQKVRLKPGIYRAESVDPPVGSDQHIFAATGSNNHFDLRGVVIETPVSVQSKLSRAAHVSDCWHLFGDNNTFEGGYFRNVIDRPYPDYSVAENEFEVLGSGNSFVDCTFVIQGSVPYGYSDFYGKGGPNFGRLNKHGFLSIVGAQHTRLSGCQVYMQSFGHCIHFHAADGVVIENCLLSGTLRPTNDIFAEQVGRAVEYDFQVMYRGKRPIPHDEMIPLTEDGIRTYGGDKNITVTDTTIERFRGCVQILCESDVTLKNVTVLEAGDFSFDVSAGDQGKVELRNCRADVAYNPVFNLTRGATPKDAFYEVTILSPAEGVKPTPRSSLGTICGERCTFILHDGTTRPLPAEANQLHCGGNKGLANSTVKNYTSARLLLSERVRDCTIESVGPVDDRGAGNRVMRIEPED
ncbi:hypothetical protein NG895_01395 [Aeoliella sp. ICT_H6.2]|uniref:Right handed beta helix domain-containing protein n=1 Tax=Aeoliella straminimaris TaxID=2954799 RepID=A0A9X2JEE6_9BACT|nr:hypothetical protein [Aeoliella straminimaris]MCO6042551.1 hypothetical protein [Aeoliella straminimaris]